MTHPSLRIASGIAQVAALALTVASLSASGCNLVTGACNCPNGGGFARVTIPAAQSSPIASVSASAPCTATSPISDLVDVSVGSAANCEVRVQLMNGDTFSFAVVFQQMDLDGACTCSVLRLANTPSPMLTDAGIDGLP